MPVDRAPVDARVVPVRVVVDHRHEHQVQALGRKLEVVVPHEGLLDIREPIAAVTPVEVFGRQRSAGAGMIVRDHVAARADDARQDLRVPTRRRVHVEHRHAGSDTEERQHLGWLAREVALAVGGRAIGSSECRGNAHRRCCGVGGAWVRAGNESGDADGDDSRACATCEAQITPSGRSPSFLPSGSVIEMYCPPFSSLRSG